MAEVAVQPGYKWTPTDIVTVDQNFLRNGNFYSSFWTNPAGVSCPVGAETQNANYWTVNPNGAAVTYKRSTDVPDLYSLWSLEIDGAVNVTDCSLGQQINGDLSATLRRPCTFSGYVENNSGALLSPTLEVWTANAFNNFNTVTLQTTVNLQSVPNAAWGYVSATIDLSLSTILNVANGLLLKIRFPSGTLSSTSKRVNCSRLKFQQGEVATEFSDDPSLFIQTTSVDSTMLQDGCLARSSLYVTNPGVIPAGAFQVGAIKSDDIANNTITASDIDIGTVLTTTTLNFTTPAANATVPVTVADGTKVTAGSTVNIQGAGYYIVNSVAGNVLTAMNTGDALNAAPITVITNPANVSTLNAIDVALGYAPVNKYGDTMAPSAALSFSKDTPTSGTTAWNQSAIIINNPSGSDNTKDPAIAFNRTDFYSRNIGLGYNKSFQTVDSAGTVGYLLDTVTGVDTNSYQDASITLQKLATSLVNILIAPGTIHIFGGPNPPSGWLICDASQYLQSTYPALYAAIGGYYGSGGSGSAAWFKVPDLRGRVPLGYVNSAVGGITGRAFGQMGGEETHVSSANEMPVHTHALSDPGHNHTISDPGHSHDYVDLFTDTAVHGYVPGTSGAANPASTTRATGLSTANLGPISTNATNMGIGNAGGGAAHNNMQPFTVMFYIIKT